MSRNTTTSRLNNLHTFQCNVSVQVRETIFPCWALSLTILTLDKVFIYGQIVGGTSSDFKGPVDLGPVLAHLGKNLYTLRIRYINNPVRFMDLQLHTPLLKNLEYIVPLSRLRHLDRLPRTLESISWAFDGLDPDRDLESQLAHLGALVDKEWLPKLKYIPAFFQVTKAKRVRSAVIPPGLYNLPPGLYDLVDSDYGSLRNHPPEILALIVTSQLRALFTAYSHGSALDTKVDSVYTSFLQRRLDKMASTTFPNAIQIWDEVDCRMKLVETKVQAYKAAREKYERELEIRGAARYRYGSLRLRPSKPRIEDYTLSSSDPAVLNAAAFAKPLVSSF